MVNISAVGSIFGAETFERTEITIQEGIVETIELSTARDMTLGTTFAAMVNQLRGHPSQTYAKSISQQILLGLGVPKKKPRKSLLRPCQIWSTTDLLLKLAPLT